MATSAEPTRVTVPKNMYSRLLYTNPVCLLTVRDNGSNGSVDTTKELSVSKNPFSLLSESGDGDGDGGDAEPATKKARVEVVERRNVMTISWLTPVNNWGGVFLSMNKKRHTASFIKFGAIFTLNIPVKGMEDLVRKIGGCSGRTGDDKFDELGIKPCEPGKWTGQSPAPGWKESAFSDDTIAIEKCVAHIVCQVVDEPVEREGHINIFAQIKEAYVQSTYWTGKQFIPVSDSESIPPYLTFLGSQEFAYVTK